MSVDRYRSRKLHRQRQFDPLYIAAAVAVTSFATTIAIEYSASDPRLVHATVDVLTFGLFLPLITFSVAWNETRPMFVGRVDYWREHGWLYRRLPGLICIDVVLRVSLCYAALPALLIGGIATAFADRALWTYGFLAIWLALAYTAFGVALALWSRSAFLLGVAYVLLIEGYAVHWWQPARWLSIREWAYAAAHVLPDSGLLPPTPIPVWAGGWVLTYVLVAVAILAASHGIIRSHAKADGVAEIIRQAHRLSGDAAPAFDPEAAATRKHRFFRRGYGRPIRETAPEPVPPWPDATPPPAPPDPVAPIGEPEDTDGKAGR